MKGKITWTLTSWMRYADWLTDSAALLLPIKGM